VSVHVEIERLVLEGFQLTAHERSALGSKIEHTLAALLREQAPTWPSEGAAVRRVVAGPTTLPSTPAVGAPVAGAIHDGIHRAVGR
jgi:hypothetical protein